MKHTKTMKQMIEEREKARSKSMLVCLRMMAGYFVARASVEENEDYKELFENWTRAAYTAAIELERRETDAGRGDQDRGER